MKSYLIGGLVLLGSIYLLANGFEKSRHLGYVSGCYAGVQEIAAVFGSSIKEASIIKKWCEEIYKETNK